MADNIIGNPFDSFVKKQIDVRQKALGKTSNISSNSLKYYTTKTPWLRLASSVDLKSGEGTVFEKLTKLGVPKQLIEENELAKNFILQGGTLSSKDPKQNKGLNYTNDIFNGAYGWGGIDERGYVPMPGVESAKTTYYNNGALSKATIKIKCFSKSQFQLIDVLYLRPGYTILLEFGWSTFLSSKKGEEGTLGTYTGFKSGPLDFLLTPSEVSTDGDKNQFTMFSLIQEERVKNSGNYDAVYGKISNFKWSFSTDGSYECEVTVIGMGSILESLKLNVIDPVSGDSGELDEELVEKRGDYYDKSFDSYLSNVLGPKLGKRVKNEKPTLDSGDWSEEEINKLVMKCQEVCGSYPTHEGAGLGAFKKLFKKAYDEYKTKYNEEAKRLTIQNLNNNPLLGNKDDTKLNKIFYDCYQHLDALSKRIAGTGNIRGKYNGKNDGKEGNTGGLWASYLGAANSAFMLRNTRYGDKNVEGDKVDSSVYLKFGVFLQILEENCNLFSTNTSSEGESTPMIKYDFNKGPGLAFDDNYMSIIPPNLSCDPSVCLVPFRNALLGENPTFPTDVALNYNLLQNSFFLVDDNPFVGRLGNVLINLRFAAKVLEESPRDDSGAISVLSYIQTILDGINESMGGINNFKVTYDEVTGLVKIWDETPKPYLVDPNADEKFATMNIFGVKKDLGSFVTNIGLDAEIPQNFATMISIGAQASGSNLQGNATGFANYNKGLIDRIIPESLDKYTSENKDEKTTTTLETIKEDKLFGRSAIIAATTGDANYGKEYPISAMYNLQGAKGTTGVNYYSYDFTPETVQNLKDNYTQYLQLMQGELAGFRAIPSPFFLPFNLNIEMEGLSGMKLFQKFRVTNDVLPPSYDEASIDIIVKAINHDVDIQSWKTTIDTQSVPRTKLVDISTLPQPKKEEKRTGWFGGMLDKFERDRMESSIFQEMKDRPRTRLRLTRLCDNKYQTLGFMEVLDEFGKTLYGLPTCELPWLNNNNVIGERNSCVPPGIYYCAFRNSPKHGDTFMISTNPNKDEFLRTGFSAPGTNNTNRTWVLIHAAPSAMENADAPLPPGGKSQWLYGCIAPGFTYNTNQTDPTKFKNPRGIGPGYKQQSLDESKAAMQKLMGTLKKVGQETVFKLEIKTLDGAAPFPLETEFNSFSVQRFISEQQQQNGEFYLSDNASNIYMGAADKLDLVEDAINYYNPFQ